MSKARKIEFTHPEHAKTLANIMLKGGIVGAIWGHHLYFLACNACNLDAVKRMNKIKGRSEDQVFVSPGAVDEAEEFADIKRSKGLIFASHKKGMTPTKYLEFLYKRFPLGVELYANDKAPSTITFATDRGRTIWIAGHMNDKIYSKFLTTVRTLRRAGKNIVFAGTSLNLRGDNTLTVKQLDKVIEDFEDKIDAISVNPNASKLKKLRYTTSCSVVSFVGSKPKLLRVGCTSVPILKKYIPGLIVPNEIKSTRK